MSKIRNSPCGSPRTGFPLLSAGDIVPARVKGNVGEDEMMAAILAVDRNGQPVMRIAERATIGVDEVKVHADPKAVVSFDQQLNLPHGQDYLDIGVWDLTSGRLGMLTVPVMVAKKKQG
ncbi:MAG TPA: hypothetical protein VHX37_00190 [Acidobacteriaceae bacterium]|nr:hypothetical protein [Acidobacteriaceae bacterium]